MNEEKINAGSVKDVPGEGLSALYSSLMRCWNDRDAKRFSVLFLEDGNMIGFDGSQALGPEAIHEHIGDVFAHHQTAAFVFKIKRIRYLKDDIGIVDAIAGMIPPGSKELNPKLNSIQTMVGQKRSGVWKIAIFQNTPAAFHGRPERVQQFTEELQENKSSA